MTAVATDPRATANGHPDPGFRSTVAAEWIKLRTARSARRNVVLAVMLGIAMSLLLSALVSATFDEWSPAEQADFDPLVFPLSGSLFVVAFLVALGVNAMSSEYRSGMIRLTFTATPRRGRVLAAKAVVVALVTLVVGAGATVAMIAVAQPVYAAGDLPTVGLAEPDVVRMLALGSLVGPAYPVLAVLVAAILRSSAAALATVLALVFAPSVVGGLLPSWWQRNVLSLLPGPASDAVAVSHLMESEQYLHPVVGGLVLLAWVVALGTLAHLALTRRDA